MNTRTIFAIVAIVAAMGLVAAVTFPSFVTPEQAFAARGPGNAFKHCHSFGPGHSNDACE
jgi:hypothetical protein